MPLKKTGIRASASGLRKRTACRPWRGCGEGCGHGVSELRPLDGCPHLL